MKFRKSLFFLIMSILIGVSFLKVSTQAEGSDLILSQSKPTYKKGERVKIGLQVESIDLDREAALYVRFTELPSDFADCEGKYLTVNGTSSKPAPIIDTTFPLYLYNSLDCINYPDQPCLFDFVAEFPGSYEITAYLANPYDPCDVIAPTQDVNYCLPNFDEASTQNAFNARNIVHFEILEIPNDASLEGNFDISTDASTEDSSVISFDETQSFDEYTETEDGCSYFHASPELANFVAEKPFLGGWISIEEYDTDEESWVKIESDEVTSYTDYLLITDSLMILKNSYTLCEEYFDYTYQNDQLVFVAKGNNCSDLYDVGESFARYVNTQSDIVEIDGNPFFQSVGERTSYFVTFEDNFNIMILEGIDEDGEIEKTKFRRLSSNELVSLWNHCPDATAIEYLKQIMNQVYK